MATMIRITHTTRRASNQFQRLRFVIAKNFSANNNKDDSAIDTGSFHTHFKATGRPHPLGVKTTIGAAQLGDHTGLQQNHIWTLEELEIKMNEEPKHKPKTITDHVMNKLVSIFNFYVLLLSSVRSFFLSFFLSSVRCMVSIIHSTSSRVTMRKIHLCEPSNGG